MNDNLPAVRNFEAVQIAQDERRPFSDTAIVELPNGSYQILPVQTGG